MVGRDVVLNNGVRMPTIIYGSGGAHTQDNVTGTAIAGRHYSITSQVHAYRGNAAPIVVALR